MATSEHKKELRRLAESLRDPLRLRIVVCGVTLAIAHFGIYSPFQQRIARAARRLQEAETREAVARDSETLRARLKQFQFRLAQDPDPNLSIQYALDGIRSLPVRLVRIDSHGTITVGPYEALSMLIEVSGELEQLDRLIAWFEANDRLFRIDSLRVEPPRGNAVSPKLQFQLLALKVRR